jgi:amidohydrolase
MRSRSFHLVTSLVVAVALGASARAHAQSAQPALAPKPALDALHKRIDKQAEAVLPRVVAWRRDLHEHPELGNREKRTARIIADHLRKLGYEVKTGVGKTGVVGVLRGGKPGPVVALRSDMDALPVVEETGLPFASKQRATYNGRDVGVMHACGHDFHMAILMGTAEVLAGMRAELPGTVKLIFQPAEEGPPEGEEGGAPLMIDQGVLQNPKVDAVFGLHVFPMELGKIALRSRGIMAASDTFTITVRGRQTHGALPWTGIDPIVVAAQIVMGLQTIISRQADLTTAPALVTVGTIEGGTRFNIIPDEVRMTGTIRTFDPEMQTQIHERVRRTAESIATASGATAEVKINVGNPVTYNDAALTARMMPSLERVAVGGFEPDTRAVTTAEDFSWYQKNVPGVFFFLGVAPRGADLDTIASNHSPRFNPDEGGLVTGVRAMASLAVDYLMGRAGTTGQK